MTAHAAGREGSTASYSCPGIAMPQPSGAPPEGYVACYRAGHHCPPKVPVVTETPHSVRTAYRCPCCGDLGIITSVPRDVPRFGLDPSVDQPTRDDWRLRGGGVFQVGDDLFDGDRHLLLSAATWGRRPGGLPFMLRADVTWHPEGYLTSP